MKLFSNYILIIKLGDFISRLLFIGLIDLKIWLQVDSGNSIAIVAMCNLRCRSEKVAGQPELQKLKNMHDAVQHVCPASFYIVE